MNHLYHHNESDARLVAILDSLEVFCLACDCEVLDEWLLRKFDCREKKALQLRRGLVSLLEDYCLQHLSTLE